jgi:hypothetical protein
MSEAPITHRLCRKCNQYKHRRLFIPRIGTGEIKYDNYCGTCRHNVNKQLSLGRVYERYKQGLASIKAVEAAKKEKKRRGLKRVAGRLKSIERSKRLSWDSVYKSARLAQDQLKRFAPASPEEAAWVAQASALIKEAVETCREFDHKAPGDTRTLWYDVLQPGRARELVDSFPGGEEKSPLVIL